MVRLSQLETFVRVMVFALLSSLAALTPASAHEVQPSVMDITLGEDAFDATIEWSIEAPLAGVDLEGLEDTNDAENAGEYDRIRALSSDAVEELFRDSWPQIRDLIRIEVDGEPVEIELDRVTSPGPGNEELARISEVRLSGELPGNGAPVTVGWDASLGPLVLRQQGIENGYTDFLLAGDMTDPITRAEAEVEPAWDAFVDYVGVGFDHIVPLGLDHILFVLGLFFLSLRMDALLWQITAFTLAHTITLALGATGIVNVPASVVEPLIAASIVYVGIENLFARGLTPWRPALIFAFGLLHGLGFASVLHDFGLSASNFVPKLIGFNVGVEIGQIAVIIVAFLTLGLWFGGQSWYRRRIAKPVSLAISLIAVFWVLDRTGMTGGADAWTPFALLTEGGLPVYWSAGVAIALALGLTLATMFASEADTLSDVAGMVTSFVMFLGIVATFTSGAWIVAAILAAVWVLAIRLQSLGGEDMTVST